MSKQCTIENLLCRTCARSSHGQRYCGQYLGALYGRLQHLSWLTSKSMWDTLALSWCGHIWVHLWNSQLRVEKGKRALVYQWGSVDLQRGWQGSHTCFCLGKSPRVFCIDWKHLETIWLELPCLFCKQDVLESSSEFQAVPVMDERQHKESNSEIWLKPLWHDIYQGVQQTVLELACSNAGPGHPRNASWRNCLGDLQSMVRGAQEQDNSSRILRLGYFWTWGLEWSQKTKHSWTRVLDQFASE